MKKMILIIIAKLANHKSNRGYAKGLNVEE